MQTWPYICLSGLALVMLGHLLLQGYFCCRFRFLQKNHSVIRNHRDDEADAWFDWLIDHHEKLLAYRLYRKKYGLSLAEMHRRIETRKKSTSMPSAKN